MVGIKVQTVVRAALAACQKMRQKLSGKKLQIIQVMYEVIISHFVISSPT
jgi:hypothetical protein